MVLRIIARRIYVTCHLRGKRFCRFRPTIDNVNRFYEFVVPHWLVTALFAIIGFVPWIPWKFSLRTLLIATTLIAVVLGLVVCDEIGRTPEPTPSFRGKPPHPLPRFAQLGSLRH